MTGELDLWRFLERREEEIIHRRKELLAELEALREVRASLEKRQRVSQQADTAERLTIKDMVRSVLTRNPEGGTSDQIANWITQLHGAEVARTSLSPQLSRLKADDEVSLDEETGIWRLAREVARPRYRATSHDRSMDMMDFLVENQRRTAERRK